MTQPHASTRRHADPDARLARAVAVAVLVVLAVAWWNGSAEPDGGDSPGSPGGSSDVPAHVGEAELLARLERVVVVPERSHRAGYDRGCGPGAGCVFGTAWSDDTDAPQARDGCDTRNDVLAAQLRDVRFSPRSPGCDVVAGELTDPYTGVSVDYATAGSRIHVDHVFPLAAAWDHGAADWTPLRRATFANDTERALIATTAAANLAKGDSTPGEWLPVHRGFRCAYLGRYLEIAAAYHLSVSAADARSVRAAAPGCGR